MPMPREPVQLRIKAFVSWSLTGTAPFKAMYLSDVTWSLCPELWVEHCTLAEGHGTETWMFSLQGRGKDAIRKRSGVKGGGSNCKLYIQRAKRGPKSRLQEGRCHPDDRKTLSEATCQGGGLLWRVGSAQDSGAGGHLSGLL